MKKNPITGHDVLLIAGGAAVLGVFGYLLWDMNRNAAQAQAHLQAAQNADTTVNNYLQQQGLMAPGGPAPIATPSGQLVPNTPEGIYQAQQQGLLPS